MKTYYRLLALFILFPSLSMAAKIDLEKTLYLVIQDLPPFAICKGKTVQESFIKEVVDAACKEGELACLIECFPNRRSKAMLKSGAAHGNYPLGWNADRDKWMIWSPKVNAVEYGFYRHKESNYQTVDDYVGKVIGVFGPSNTQKSLTKIRDELYVKKGKTFEISVQPSSTGVNIRKLSIGRLDGVYINRDIGADQLKKLNIDNVDYAFSMKQLNYYIGFSKVKNNGKRKALIHQFNQSIFSIRNQGIIKTITEKYGMKEPISDIR